MCTNPGNVTTGAKCTTRVTADNLAPLSETVTPKPAPPTSPPACKTHMVPLFMSDKIIWTSEPLWHNQATNRSKSWLLEKGLKHHTKATTTCIFHIDRRPYDPRAHFLVTQRPSRKAKEAAQRRRGLPSSRAIQPPQIDPPTDNPFKATLNHHWASNRWVSALRRLSEKGVRKQ